MPALLVALLGVASIVVYRRLVFLPGLVRVVVDCRSSPARDSYLTAACRGNCKRSAPISNPRICLTIQSYQIYKLCNIYFYIKIEIYKTYVYKTFINTHNAYCSLYEQIGHVKHMYIYICM